MNILQSISIACRWINLISLYITHGYIYYIKYIYYIIPIIMKVCIKLI